jgi:hypothetical protein
MKEISTTPKDISTPSVAFKILSHSLEKEKKFRKELSTTDYSTVEEYAPLEEMHELDVSIAQKKRQLSSLTLQIDKDNKSKIMEGIEHRYSSADDETKSAFAKLIPFINSGLLSPCGTEKQETVANAIIHIIDSSMSELVKKETAEERKKEYKFIKAVLKLNFLHYDRLSAFHTNYNNEVLRYANSEFKDIKDHGVFSSVSEGDAYQQFDRLVKQKKSPLNKNGFFSSVSEDAPQKETNYFLQLSTIIRNQLDEAPGAPEEKKNLMFGM